MNPSRRIVRMLALMAALMLPAVSAHAHGDHDDHDDERRVTVWQDGIEVYIPHPPLLAGEPAQLTVFITALEGYRPIDSGTLSASLRIDERSAIDASVDGPLGNGIFLLGLSPAPAGEHRLLLTLQGTERTHRAEVPLQFVTSASDVHPEDHEEIIFTKARQRLIPFATEEVVEEAIAPRITVPAVVEAMPGQRLEMSAAARGMLQAADGRDWPMPGQRVRRGEVLAKLVPLAGADDMARLASDAEAARARVAIADAALERTRRLVDEGVLAGRQLLEAEAEATTARSAMENLEAQLAALRGRAGSGAIALRAPFDGVVTESAFAPGQIVEPGARIVTVIDDHRVGIRVQLLASDLAAVSDPQDLRLRRPGSRNWEQPAQRLAQRGTAPSENGIFSLLYEIPNDGSWIPGMPLIASLAVDEPLTLPVVPETAVLDDDGVAVVLVQHGGEEFERRPVRTGLRSAGRIAVLEGLDAGERVVSRGAYAVLLAGREPATAEHSHSH